MSELRELVREVYAANLGGENCDIAFEVFVRTPPERRDDFYQEALAVFVGDVLRRDRNAAMNAHTPAEDDSEDEESDGGGEGMAEEAPQPKPARDPHKTSPVVNMIRCSTAWKKILIQRVYVAGGSRATTIGECTAADLRELATRTRRTGDAFYKKADDYDSYATWVDRCGKTTLGECPELKDAA